MVEQDIVPVLTYFVECESENHAQDIFRNILLKRRGLFRILFLFLLLVSGSVPSLHARHKCPKVPAPPGLMGIFSSTTLIPSGSTMAAARSSEISGCDHGHPSDNFYKPQKKRMAFFLKENFPQVSQESAQGHGQHLDALALLAGCTVNHAVFAEIIQKNYEMVFGAEILNLHPGLSPDRADRTSERLINMISDTPLLASSCESG